MVKTLDIFISMLGAATLLWFAGRSAMKCERPSPVRTAREQ